MHDYPKWRYLINYLQPTGTALNNQIETKFNPLLYLVDFG